jgi:hypothetical protein
MTTETYHYKLNGDSRIVTRAPKQRLIKINLVCVDGHQSINYNAHIKARTNLSKNAFQLYDYLEFLPHGMIWAMSSSNLYAESALKEDTYAKAFRELIDKGYLWAAPISTDDGVVNHDTYHFYEDCEMNPKKKYEVTQQQTVKQPSWVKFNK